jgi:hypothetical protein
MLEGVSKGRTFSAECHGNNILTELLPLRLRVDPREFIVQVDNARSHTQAVRPTRAGLT